jgi:hypothetical protein
MGFNPNKYSFRLKPWGVVGFPFSPDLKIGAILKFIFKSNEINSPVL